MNTNNRLKVKLHAAVNVTFRTAFEKLATDSAVTDPKGEAWGIARTMRKLKEHNDDFQSVKRALAERLGKPIDGDPKKGFDIPAEKNAEWMETLTPILEKEVEVYLDHKILLTFPLPANSRLNASDLELLMDLVDEAPKEIVQLPGATEAVASAPVSEQPAADANQRTPGSEAGTAAS